MKLGAKIDHYEAFLGALAQDRDFYSSREIIIQPDNHDVAKTWVRQLDHVISTLRGLVDDWKELESYVVEVVAQQQSAE